MSNNINDLRAEINRNSEAIRLELLERIDQRSRLSSRSSTRAGSSGLSSSKQLALRHAVTLNATIPVVTVPVIVTALKTPPLYFAVPDNEISRTHMEPIPSVTNITALESPQPLETMIEVPVHTSTSQHDITPPFKSNLASEAIPMDDNRRMDADDYNDKKSVTFCDVTNQFSESTQQLEQPCSIFIKNNSLSNCAAFYPRRPRGLKARWMENTKSISLI